MAKEFNNRLRDSAELKADNEGADNVLSSHVDRAYSDLTTPRDKALARERHTLQVTSLLFGAFVSAILSFFATVPFSGTVPSLGQWLLLAGLLIGALWSGSSMSRIASMKPIQYGHLTLERDSEPNR